MRRLLFVLALIGAIAATAIPATAKQDPAKPTGEKCIQRAQAAGLSETGTAAATAACTKYAATVRDSRAVLRAAKATYRAQAKAARAEFRADRSAATGRSADAKAARKAARAERRAALRAARQVLKAARQTHRSAVKAAKQTLRAELRAARAA